MRTKAGGRGERGRGKGLTGGVNTNEGGRAMVGARTVAAAAAQYVYYKNFL